MKKILTVIIPTYNMELYLDRCLSSLLIDDIQIFKMLEVLVINDGSQDSSSVIAHMYERNYPEIFRVIDKENGNYGSCINRGIKESKGIWLRILDADDWFDKEGFQKFLFQLISIETDAVITNFSQCMVNGDVIKRTTGNTDYGKVINLNDVDLVSSGHAKVVAMHGLTIRTDILKHNSYIQQEGISYTDIEYTFFSLLYSKTVVFLNIDLYQYFIGREGQSVSTDQELRHYSDFRKVGIRLAAELIKNTGALNKAKEDLLANLILRSVGYTIIAFPLAFFKKPTEEMRIALEEFDNLICQNKSLYKFATKLTFKKLRFYYIWKKWGIRIGLFIGKKYA